MSLASECPAPATPTVEAAIAAAVARGDGMVVVRVETLKAHIASETRFGTDHGYATGYNAGKAAVIGALITQLRNAANA